MSLITMDALAGANRPLLALGLALVLLALVLLALLGVRRRRAGRADASVPGPELAPVSVLRAVPDVDPEPADADLPSDLSDRDDGSDRDDRSPGSATVRALRAQVRVLEQALEAADRASYRTQVDLAVRAVAARTHPTDDPRHAVARVAAAISRLEVTDGLTRPVLPSRPATPAGSVPAAGSPIAPAAPAPALLTSAHRDEGTEDPDVAPTVQRRQRESTVPADAATDQRVAQVEDELVLPVPPPAPAAPRRGRRWHRHSAA